MRAAVGMWTRGELRRRFRALLLLGLLGGLVGGLALAAVAGARRTDTAYQRFREATGRSDAIVFGTLIGLFPADYGPVRALPEVEDAGEFTLAPLEVQDHQLGQLAPNDDRLYRTVNRPLLVAGRLPDPARADEILIDRQAAKQSGLGVGDRTTIQSSTELFNPSVPMGSGPSFDVTVVGVGDSNMGLTFSGDEGGFVPSAALLAQHPEIPRAGNLVVRLRPGTDVAAFGQRAADAMGVPNIPVRDLAEDTKRVTHGTDLERAALLLFAAAVALAGLVLVGQAVARTVYSLAEPADALRAVGFTRNGLIAGLLAPLGLTAAMGVMTAIAAAIALSRLFPVGLAGRLEPDRGVHADWLVLGPGAVAVGLSILAGAGVAALRATSGRRTPVGDSRRSLSRFLGRAPLPAMIGAGLALERGHGRRALPVRPALASAVAAVLGVVGAFGLLHGIDGALSHPERSGQFWAAEVTVDRETKPGTLATLVGSDQVAAVTVLRFVDTDVDGSSVATYALEPTKADRAFTVIEGRQLSGPDDLVLGPATARALGRKVGDTVRVGGAEGRDLRLVGLGLLPQTPHFSFDQGAWVSPQELDALTPTPDPEGPSEETVLVSFAPHLAATAGVARLTEELGPAAQVEPASIPADVGYLRNVRSLPKALAAFLVFLGLGALAHVLATAVRRRRHDLAVLRAIGFRPLQLAGCVAWQAATVALVALLVGIPLGIAAGRWSWRWVADTTPLLYVAPVAATVVVLSVPVTLVLANAMAALPARRAARLRPADVLRAE